uniref:Uncharacterized protein n=1 Tax=Parascaris equorum TaxID=6256 RepID=A0A914RKA3_PAREQ
MSGERISHNRTTSDCRVLVTGATGYLAIHCIQQLLKEGYTCTIPSPIPFRYTKLPPLMAMNKWKRKSHKSNLAVID